MTNPLTLVGTLGALLSIGCNSDPGTIQVEKQRETTPVVQFTAAAAGRARSYLGPRDIGLRISVKKEGPTGFMYEVSTESRRDARDTLSKSHGLNLLVDPESQRYLVGTVIDWVESKDGGGLVFHNPNAREQ